MALQRSEYKYVNKYDKNILDDIEIIGKVYPEMPLDKYPLRGEDIAFLLEYTLSMQLSFPVPNIRTTWYYMSLVQGNFWKINRVTSGTDGYYRISDCLLPYNWGNWKRYVTFDSIGVELTPNVDDPSGGAANKGYGMVGSKQPIKRLPSSSTEIYSSLTDVANNSGLLDLIIYGTDILDLNNYYNGRTFYQEAASETRPSYAYYPFRLKILKSYMYYLNIWSFSKYFMRGIKPSEIAPDIMEGEYFRDYSGYIYRASKWYDRHEHINRSERAFGLAKNVSSCVYPEYGFTNDNKKISGFVYGDSSTEYESEVTIYIGECKNIKLSILIECNVYQTRGDATISFDKYVRVVLDMSSYIKTNSSGFRVMNIPVNELCKNIYTKVSSAIEYVPFSDDQTVDFEITWFYMQSGFYSEDSQGRNIMYPSYFFGQIDTKYSDVLKNWEEGKIKTKEERGVLDI